MSGSPQGNSEHRGSPAAPSSSSSVSNNPNLNNLLNRSTSDRPRHHAPSLSNMREYCLRWNNHQPNFVSFFTSLLTKESFVDVTLVSSEGKRILAHKLVLSACSPYFQHVFENNPCKHPIVIMKDVNYLDLSTIVNFIYNGEVNISQDRINSILATASTLQIKGLAEVPPDELKRVSGPKMSTESNRSQFPNLYPSASTVSWNSGNNTDIPSPDIPRKKLKKSSSTGGVGSSSINGDEMNLSSYDYESRVGASRSVDEGSSQNIECSKSSPTAPPPLSRPPPLTAGTSIPKAQSLDTGLERSGGDSELSSGGFSEHHNYDEQSGERGYDLEVSDIKLDVSSVVERGVGGGGSGGVYEEEEEYYDDPDEIGEEYGEHYLNMSASSTASYFQQQQAQYDSKLPRTKYRRGRLTKQPRIKRLLENEIEGNPPPQIYPNNESSSGSSEEPELLSIYNKDEKEPSSAKIPKILPIVTVSTSSPTPPLSPQLLIDESAPSAIEDSTLTLNNKNKTLAQSQLLALPSSSSISHPPISSSTTPILTKQISEPDFSLLNRKQEEQPAKNILKNSPRGLSEGTYFRLIPSHSQSQENTNFEEGSILVERTLGGYLQILPKGESSTITATKSSSSGPKKAVEVFKIGRSSSESVEGESFSIDEESGSSLKNVPVQRSGHCPALRGGPALGCNYCWNSMDYNGRILRRKTKYHCPECHINLCIVPCFQEFHEQAEKKRIIRGKGLLAKPSSL